VNRVFALSILSSQGRFEAELSVSEAHTLEAHTDEANQADIIRRLKGGE
jgi:hypothetical protein